MSSMRTNTQQQRFVSPAEEMGLGPKKTILILCTVVGCIAILFPKIFYPMMFTATLDANRGPPNLFKQERPPHMKDIVHPGMQERGRAIPPHPSVPIVERPGGRPLPGNIERRAGGIPGHPGASLRAAAFQAQQQQQQQKGGHSMIMPLYTFCIVAFFVFTLVKILLKKTKKTKVEPIMEPDPKFAEKVFNKDNKKKLVYTAIQGIIDATTEQLSEIEKECAEKNKEHNTDKRVNDEERIKLNGNEKLAEKDDECSKEEKQKVKENESFEDTLKLDENHETELKTEQSDVKSEHDIEIEKRLYHLKEAMHIKSVENDENSDLKSIYLEGELPHDPKIFVSATETETKTEKLSQYPSKDAVDEDETVILSGKMTISLISLANNDEEKNGIIEDHTTTNNVA